MKYFIALAGFSFLSACTHVPSTYDATYNVSEISDLSSAHFETEKSAVERALRPTFKKYGQPHVFVSGQMSSVDHDDLSRLYGSGRVRRKVLQDGHTFWQIDGPNLAGHMRPMKAAHLIYDTAELGTVTDKLPVIGSLNQRDESFTIFEREKDGLIIISVHQTKDLPSDTAFNAIRFFEQ